MASLPTSEEIRSEALDLSIEMKGVRFKNPIIVGSAGYAEDERGIRRWIGKGYAGVVGKSTSRMALRGAPPPKVFWLDPQTKMGIDGAEAHRNPGIEEMSRFMNNLKEEAKNEDCRLIGSVSGQSVEEAVYVARKYEEAGVSCIEVDAMCPSTGPHLGPQYVGRGKYWAQDVARSIELVKGLKSAVSVPVWYKTTAPLLFRIMDDLEKEVKPDAYSYTPENLPGIRIDVETGKPRFSGNTEILIAQKRKFIPRPTATGLPADRAIHRFASKKN
jgi:dihydroorotate dehydrogenase